MPFDQEISAAARSHGAGQSHRGADGVCLHEIDLLLASRATGTQQRLLVVQCGRGRAALNWAALGYQVTGIDLGTQHIADARQAAAMHTHGQACTFRSMFPTNLLFEAGTFDLVVVLDTLAGATVGRIMEEVHRVLRPGGTAMVIARPMPATPRHDVRDQESLDELAMAVHPRFEHVEERRLMAGDICERQHMPASTQRLMRQADDRLKRLASAFAHLAATRLMVCTGARAPAMVASRRAAA